MYANATKSRHGGPDHPLDARPVAPQTTDGRRRARAMSTTTTTTATRTARALASLFTRCAAQASVGVAGPTTTTTMGAFGAVAATARGGAIASARAFDRRRGARRASTRDGGRRDAMDEMKLRSVDVRSSRRENAVVKTCGTDARPRSVASIRSIEERPSLEAGQDGPGRGKERERGARGGTARRGARESIDRSMDGWMDG